MGQKFHFTSQPMPSKKRLSPCLTCQFHELNHIKALKNIKNAVPENSQMIEKSHNSVLFATNRTLEMYKILKSHHHHDLIQQTSIQLNSTQIKSQKDRYFFSMKTFEDFLLIFENKHVTSFKADFGRKN